MTRLSMGWALVACLTVLTGCANLRVYTTFEYKHLRTETENKPTGEREFVAGIFREGSRWLIRVMETRTCQRRTIEVAEETANIKVTAPTWYYFVGLGGLTAAGSVPFWALGATAKSKKLATQNYLVASLLFMLPGLAIAATGIYYRLRAGTRRKKMGLRRLTKSKVSIPCSVKPAQGRHVRLGSRTGQKSLGRTDAHGKVTFESAGLRPLVRWDGGRVVKVYFEVQVENEPGQEVKLPKGFPLHPADLKEPRLNR